MSKSKNKVDSFPKIKKVQSDFRKGTKNNSSAVVVEMNEYQQHNRYADFDHHQFPRGH